MHYPDTKELSLFDIAEMCRNDKKLRLIVIGNMQEFGGSFVKALAVCFIRADNANLTTLCHSFVNYVADYWPTKWKVT